MRLRALAKINLGLDVVGKRADGYHEVRMIMQTIQMYDVLEIEKKAEPGMNRIFGLGLSEEDLMKRAVKVGADVPYCVMRGTALAEGIGEKLTRLPRVPQCYVLVGKPGVNVSTKTAYENLKLDDPAVVHPDIDGMVTAIREGDLDGMISRMGNVFEPGIIGKYPVIQEIKDLMENHGARKAMMSGSGPTVFGIFDSREKMEQAAAVLRESKLAKTVFATEVF